MQVFLKYPENIEKSMGFTSFIILEFQGKMESTQEDVNGLELGDLSKISETVEFFSKQIEIFYLFLLKRIIV